MKTKRKLAVLLMLTIALSILQTGCTKAKEDTKDMGQAIAEFLEVDKVTLDSTAVVGKYHYVCFFYKGETEAESGYSYAAFRRKATGDLVLEFAQVPSKLLPIKEGISGAYFDDHLILVSSNENLDKIVLTGEINAEVKVNRTPFIYAVDIFEGTVTAKQMQLSFFDKEGNEIR